MSSQMAKADDLKYQELTRVMPPAKAKSYPILESLELKLYPSQDFRQEQPGHRLERIEIAMFGSIQSGSISDRVERLRSEVANWQIATASPISRNPVQQLNAARNDDDISTPERYALEAQVRTQEANERMRYSKFLMDERTKARQETNIVRVGNPIVQRLGKRSIDAMFGVKQKG
jgi:hypothetical protein